MLKLSEQREPVDNDNDVVAKPMRSPLSGKPVQAWGESNDSSATSTSACAEQELVVTGKSDQHTPRDQDLTSPLKRENASPRRKSGRSATQSQKEALQKLKALQKRRENMTSERRYVRNYNEIREQEAKLAQE